MQAPDETAPETTAPEPEYQFEAVLEAGEEANGGVFVVVPADVSAALGSRARVPVRASFDGFPYQGSLSPLGDGHHALLVLKEIRRALDITLGDTVRVTLARDTAPRKIAIPDDLADALGRSPSALNFFNELAYSHQREYVRWLEGAKKEYTRRKRVEETVERLQKRQRRA